METRYEATVDGHVNKVVAEELLPVMGTNSLCSYQPENVHSAVVSSRLP